MSTLLECLRTASPLPSHAAALAHYSHQAALAAKLDKYAPPACHPDYKRIEFASTNLDGEMVTADLEIDREPLHYQHGTSRGSVEVCGIYVRGWNAGMYMDKSTLASVSWEAECEAWRLIDAGVL